MATDINKYKKDKFEQEMKEFEEFEKELESIDIMSAFRGAGLLPPSEDPITKRYDEENIRRLRKHNEKVHVYTDEEIEEEYKNNDEFNIFE